MIDTVIIGAGSAGLCAAKTILQCDPQADVRILDAGESVGGVWAKEKLYPGLKTNHFFGGLDFSDFAMPISDIARPGTHMPGQSINEHLLSYAYRWDLLDRIELRTKVTEATWLDDGSGWELKVQKRGESTLRCKKLIVAMGLNNAPKRPQLKGDTSFKAPIIHSSELGRNSDTILNNTSIKTMTVLGGGKSSYDAVHSAAVAGHEVDWVIRKSGKGPAWVFPLMTKIGPIPAQIDRLPARRLITLFSPCIWQDGLKRIRQIIHTSFLGKLFVNFFWAQMHATTLADCHLKDDEKLKPLIPEQSPFWYGTVAGACQYLPDLRERIHKGQIRVYREDVDHLSENTVHLADGRQLRADALITATGFSPKPLIKFSPPELHSSFGIPSNQYSKDQHEMWAEFDARSDLSIGIDYPGLLAGPSQTCTARVDPSDKYTPWRLLRSIAPPGLTAGGDHSLVFIGVFSNFANFVRAEIQCLWAYAYLNGKLTVDPKTTYQEASLFSRYSRYRSPLGHGAYYSDHVFDQIPYFDTLLQDLGLPHKRKSNAWKEMFEHYEAKDYRGIVDEWLARNQETKIQT